MRGNQRRATVHAKTKRRRTVVAVAGSLMLCYAAYAFFFDTMGFMKYLSIKRTQAQIAEEIRVIEDKNTRLRQEIQAVKHDPATIESLARERLGMVQKGEKVFLFVPDARQSGSSAERP